MLECMKSRKFWKAEGGVVRKAGPVIRSGWLGMGEGESLSSMAQSGRFSVVCLRSNAVGTQKTRTSAGCPTAIVTWLKCTRERLYAAFLWRESTVLRLRQTFFFAWAPALEEDEEADRETGS